MSIDVPTNPATTYFNLLYKSVLLLDGASNSCRIRIRLLDTIRELDINAGPHAISENLSVVDRKLWNKKDK